MNFEKPENLIKEKDIIDFQKAENYPTLADLMKEQNVLSYQSDYWKKECDTNPSNPRCLIYED